LKFFILHIAVVAAFSAFCGDLDVARQALADGIWRSAVAAADKVSGDPALTNSAERTAARLISLEALARLEDDAEIRRRLAEWKDSSSGHFRYWEARSLIRVGDFDRATALLEAPFAEVELELPVKTLKAALLVASGKFKEALDAMSGVDLGKVSGPDGDDARMIAAEALLKTGKASQAQPILDSLARDSRRREIRLRAACLLGFSEMDNPSTFTSGVDRVRGVLRLAPGDAVSEAAARAFADRLLKAGDAAGAEDEYRRFLEVFPSAVLDSLVLENRGRALYLMGRNSEAAGMFARAEQTLESAADKSRLAYLQANAYLAEGKLASAAASFARSASYGGENADRSLYAQADALERAGEVARASQIYSDLSGRGGVWGAKAELRLISVAARSGRLGEAIERYTKVIVSPGSLSADDLTEAYLGRGRACYRDYRFREASADFEKVADRRPELADGMRFLMALCLYGAGRDTEAKRAATALMNSTKDDALRADLVLWCAKYEFNHGEYREAQGHFTQYADLRKGTPPAADALLWAARCASAQLEYPKAVELATRAANSSASDKTLFIEALLVQGEALMELGRYAEAAQLFDRVANLAGEGTVSQKAAMLKADALYAMGAGDTGRYEEAIAAYRVLFDVGGLSPDLRIETSFKIGRALEKLRRKKEAMDQYYRNVVLAYAEETSKGVFLGAPARTFFSRAAFSLADYYAAAGDFAAVRKMLERVVAADVQASGEAKSRLDELNAKGDGS
jgi:tetratricopeptide (TPR) repeat protein